MGKITEDDARYLAGLAKLSLEADELAAITADLNDILQYARNLQALALEAQPMAHVLPLHNVFRRDEVRPSLPRAEVLANAPGHLDGHFKVPRIIKE